MMPDDALAQWIPEDESGAKTLIQALSQRAHQLGQALASPPPPPDNCCGNGCIGCVWEGYGQEVAWWRDEVLNNWGEIWRQVR